MNLNPSLSTNIFVLNFDKSFKNTGIESNKPEKNNGFIDYAYLRHMVPIGRYVYNLYFLKKNVILKNCEIQKTS